MGTRRSKQAPVTLVDFWKQIKEPGRYAIRGLGSGFSRLIVENEPREDVGDGGVFDVWSFWLICEPYVNEPVYFPGTKEVFVWDDLAEALEKLHDWHTQGLLLFIDEYFDCPPDHVLTAQGKLTPEMRQRRAEYEAKLKGKKG